MFASAGRSWNADTRAARYVGLLAYFAMNISGAYHVNPRFLLEVLLEMKAVGICGSDVHYWQHGVLN